HRFIEAVPGKPVILMGNSMGGMISLLEAVAAPEAVSGLVLIDPALPFVPTRPDPVVTAMFAIYAIPCLNQVLLARRRRMSAEGLVASTLALGCVDRSRVPVDVVAAHVSVARQRVPFRDTGRDFVAAARSVMSTAGYLRGAPYRRGIRRITAPVLLLHG